MLYHDPFPGLGEMAIEFVRSKGMIGVTVAKCIYIVVDYVQFMMITLHDICF